MASASKNVRDPNTLSNYHNWLTTNTTIAFDIDFERNVLSGKVQLQLKAQNKDEKPEILLDTSYLSIGYVKLDGERAKFELVSRFEPYGSVLKIEVPANHGGENLQLDIQVETTEGCTALQWLTPAQNGGKHPYVFSQCQAIHARSIFPCQDTPDVKSTFDFKIRSPLPVIASGLFTGAKDFRPGKDGAQGTLLYTFKQDVPIPSYLFAVASGDIATAAVGPRSAVAAGPGKLEACKWEVEEDTERFIQAAEVGDVTLLKMLLEWLTTGQRVAGPYVWTTYNMLILPPSFPYGGMENPVYTFATPTFITGDRQNVDMIAHELAHSWSGNLVTNASWEHFWLNEGWTMYLQRRIEAAIHGEPTRSFSAIIGWKLLTDSVDDFGADHEFTKLIPDLKGKDPDDAFSTVPYEKGFTFLYHLEKGIGKAKWDGLIPHYFTSFARRSLDSYDFKAFVLDFFSNDKEASAFLGKLDWEWWFYTPGLPPKPEYDTSLVDACYVLAAKWEKRSQEEFQPKASDIADFTSSQVVVFLENVRGFEKPMDKEGVVLMNNAYGFAKSGNAEILTPFLQIGLKARNEELYGVTTRFLGEVGRMKFVRPLYVELNKANHDLAVKTFEKNKDFYHPICRGMVQKDLFETGTKRAHYG